ncbi:MAG: O-antigen ligase family protein [Paludibacteraceae bacterium]
MKQSLKSIIAYIPVVALIMVVLSQPFIYGEIERWALITFFVSLALDYLLNQRYRTFVWTREKWTFVAFIVFFLMIYLWNIGGAQPRYFLKMVETRLPYLGFGIIGILGLNDKFRLRYFAYAVIASAVLMVLFLLFKTNFHPFEMCGDTVLFNIMRRQYINSHMLVNLYFNSALICVAYILLNRHIVRGAKIVSGISGVIVAFALLISEGRTGLLTSFLIVAVVLTIIVWRWKKWMVLPLYLVLLTTFGVVFHLNQRMQRITQVDDPRLVIWRLSADMIKERPLLGYGPVEARSQFVERGLQDEEFCRRYADSYFHMPIIVDGSPDKFAMHPHNAYMETMLQFGVVGLIVLLLTVLLPLIFAPPSRRLFIALTVLAFCMQGMFESIGPQLSSLSYSIWICLWLQGRGSSQGIIETNASTQSEYAADGSVL